MEFFFICFTPGKTQALTDRFPYNPWCTSLMCDDLKENLKKKTKKIVCNHHVQTSLLICAICRKFWPVSLVNFLGNTTLTIVWECAMSGVLQYTWFSHSLSARFGKSKWITSLKKKAHADSKGPDQTAHVHSLYWAFAVRLHDRWLRYISSYRRKPDP